MRVQVKMPENWDKSNNLRQTSNKEDATIVFRAWIALTMIQLISVEHKNQEAKCG